MRQDLGVKQKENSSALSAKQMVMMWSEIHCKLLNSVIYLNSPKLQAGVCYCPSLKTMQTLNSMQTTPETSH